MPFDDAEIMQRVQHGQVELFDLLVKKYRDALLRVAHSKLGEATSAEDAVQEALLNAYGARHTYDSRFTFRTWLWTILLNVCRKHYQRHARHAERFAQALTIDPSFSYGEPATGETALSGLMDSERRQELERLLEKLPEVQADALRLRFFGGLKFDEIAQAMNCSLNGAKKRVRIGLLTLARHIREADGEML